uniref:Pco106335 n=1 Tax=Arundo donax TaxID=35708 RepID=A0A0A9GQX6_ARUDO
MELTELIIHYLGCTSLLKVELQSELA